MGLRFNGNADKVPAYKEIDEVFLWNGEATLYVKVLELLLTAPTYNGGFSVAGKLGNLLSG